jgi:predicted outer membrane repeat protein
MKTFKTNRILASPSVVVTMLTLLAGISVANASIVISEFRTRGPAGAGDEFVELYNNSDTAVDVSGWKINASNNAGTTSTRLTITAGTMIPARGHFLAAGPAYGGSVTGNQTYGTGITDDGGIALLMPDDTIVDQVGLSAGSAYKEGSVLTPQTTNTDQGYERKGGGGLGSTQDANNNATDFRLRSAGAPQNLSSAATPPFTALVVTDCADNGGANQLRQKIIDAQAAGGANITFTCGPNIVLNAGPLPTITSNVFIDGANNVEISGNNSTVIFVLDPTATLVLKNINITHGYGSSSDGGAVASADPRNPGDGILSISNSHFLFNSTSSSWSGSAISSTGPLIITGSEFAFNTGGGGAVKARRPTAITTITACLFHDNQSDSSGGGGFGGAMQTGDGAFVSIQGSAFYNNSAPYGAAISTEPSTTVNVEGTTFSTNTASGGGALFVNGTAKLTNCTFDFNQALDAGAIWASTNAMLTVETSTFSDNTVSGATYGSGGGIRNQGNTTLKNVTFTQNSAPYGGGIYNVNGTLNLTSVTLAGNSAYTTSSPAGGYGGGIHNSATLTATNCTLSSNSADAEGGGITNYGTATLLNVTFSGNSSGIGGNIENHASVNMTNTLLVKGANSGNCDGTVGGSANLADDSTCGFGAVNNILLGPLANNGGFTQTHLPQPGSAAINGGTPSGAPARDQRSYIRDAAPDVGAVEVGGTLLPASTSVVSNKTHGAMAFGIPLPLTGNGAVECRSGGAAGDHQLVLSFAAPVTVTGAGVTKGMGNVSSVGINGSQVIVNLTGVANAQNIFTTLFDVSDGTNSNDITIPVGLLLGDTTGNGTVNSSDISQTKGQSGTVASSGNFRTDVTVNGSINSSDISTVKSKSGTALP